MSYEIICPYCFGKMRDDEVMFRSDVVNQGDNEYLPDDYIDIEDFEGRYRGPDKEELLTKMKDWEFFAETDDEEYENFWKTFNGTTEFNPADEVFKVKAYRRRVIDPNNPDHQRFLKRQPDGSFFIRDGQQMVTQIELASRAKCNLRVCRHCHNPLPDNYGKNTVKFATIIGITGAGKTVYLSQLLHKMMDYCAKAGLTAIVNNTSVRTFVENNRVAAKTPLPGSTPAERFQQPLFYEMIRDEDGKHVTETFVLYDVAGEVFTSPALVSKFAPFVEHADGIVVLIDPMQFSAIHGVATKGVALAGPSTALVTVHHIVTHGIADRKCDVPVAICLSKVDTEDVQRVLSDDLRRRLLEDVRGVKDDSGFIRPLFNAKEYNPIAKELNSFIQGSEFALAQLMQVNYNSYAYFAFTALGCAVCEGERENGEKYQYPEGPVLPKRVEEPILWLFNQLGYIGENEPLFSPVRRKSICPQCGGNNTVELEGDDQWMEVVRRRVLRRSVVERVFVNRRCLNEDCGYCWEEITQQ